MNFHGDGLAIGLPAFRKPFAERSGESFGIDLQAGFHLSFGNWQSVVKFGRAGEVAHAEGVQPVERTLLALAIDDRLDFQFLRVHEGSIASVPAGDPAAQSGPSLARVTNFGRVSCQEI